MQGKIAEAENRYQEAISIYQKGVSNCKRLDNFSEAAGLNIGISKVFRKIGNRDSTIWYAREAQEYAEKLGHWDPIIQSSRILATEYENSNEDLAIFYFKKLITASDSLSSIAQLEAFEDVLLTDQQQQMEIQRSREEVINRARLYGLITVLFFTLVIVVILLRNNRRKQLANQKLGEQKEQIEIQRSQLQQSLEQLKETQSQLIQSEKMASLGELTAGIAHEIQNPLNFVNNFSEVNSELFDELSEEIRKGNEKEINIILNDLRENENKIKHHGKRADAIVKSMLQHSRISSGEKELTNINALCDEYLRLAYHGFRAKDKAFNANFKLDLDESLPNIEVVPQDIGRVLLNLINNAFQAVNVKAQNFASQPYNPMVTIATRNFGDKIEIHISDNGPGIPDEIKDKIFQPFFTTKPTGQGTGLGLSLSYDIVKAHGGKLEVLSREDEGTEFIIQIPIKS